MSDEEDKLLKTVEALQIEIDLLKEDVAFYKDDAASERARANDLEIQLENSNVPTAAGDQELQSLAQTIRTCQRNGHPDFGKHLDNLLKKLGA